MRLVQICSRRPFVLIWLVVVGGVAVAVGVFPIIRRLLKRLENLQRGVKRFGEGDLSVRVPEHGQIGRASCGERL